MQPAGFGLGQLDFSSLHYSFSQTYLSHSNVSKQDKTVQWGWLGNKT